MKRILFAVICLLILTSCGEKKKENEVEKTKTESSKTETKTKKNVIVDADGVANVLIGTNDVMKYSIKSFKVKAGQKIKLTLKHTGKLDKKVMGHNVVFLKNGVKLSDFGAKAAASKDNDYIPENSSEILAHTKMIGGGETTTIAFVAPEKGTYDFICSFPAHFAIMKGKLIVE